jgi:hypothetical protein
MTKRPLDPHLLGDGVVVIATRENLKWSPGADADTGFGRPGEHDSSSCNSRTRVDV